LEKSNSNLKKVEQENIILVENSKDNLTNYKNILKKCENKIIILKNKFENLEEKYIEKLKELKLFNETNKM